MRITQRTQETEAEKLERLQREREQMRLAIASYTGPVTKCPPFSNRPERQAARPTALATTEC